MIPGNIDVSQGMYNQASFQQIRLHEIVTRIDRLSVNLFVWNEDFAAYNYQIVFNDLNSLYLSVSAKLTRDKTVNDVLVKGEVDKIERVRKLIRSIMRSNPISSVNNISSFNSYKINLPNYDNQDKINDLLIHYRFILEEFIDAHGLGNPNKKDARSAIIDN